MAEFYVNKKKVLEVPIEIAAPHGSEPMEASFPLSALGNPNPAHLGLRLTDPTNTVIPSKLIYVDPNVSLEFTPKYSGIHIAEILLNDETIAEVPIEVNRPELPHPKPEEIKPADKKQQKPMSIDFPLATLGNPNPAHLKLLLKDPLNKTIPSELVIKDDNVYLTFTPMMNGLHKGEVYVDDDKVAEIPIEVHRPELPEPSPEELSKVSKHKPLQTAFPLSALGIKDPAKMSIKLKDPAKKEIPVIVRVKGDNVTIEFTPTYSGTYVADVYVNTELVAQVPIEVSEPHLPEAPASDKDKLASTAKKPMSASFPLSALGIVDPDKLEIKVKDPNGEYISVSVRVKDDNVTIEFLPKFCGTYMGEIMVNGALIASVPIEVNRPDLPKAEGKPQAGKGSHVQEATQASGKGKSQSSKINLRKLGITDTSTVTIKVRNPRDEEIHCDVQIERDEASVSFMAYMSGTFKILIFSRSALVATIPVEVVLSADYETIRVPSHVEKFLIPIDIPQGVNWKLITLYVTTLKGVKINTQVTIIEEHQVIKIVLTPPKQSGEYYLHLEINGKPLPSTPLQFEVFLAPQVIPSGTELSIKVGRMATIPFSVSVVSARKLQVRLIGPDGKEIKCTIKATSR